MTTYIVAATGGLEQPSFFSHSEEHEARQSFRNLSENCLSEPGDRIDLLLLEGPYVKVVDTAVYEG